MTIVEVTEKCPCYLSMLTFKYSFEIILLLCSNFYRSVFSNVFEDDITNIWNYGNSIDQYKALGGTSRISVLEQIQKLQNWIITAKRGSVAEN